MNVGIGTEAAQFPEKENINGIFVAVWITTILLHFICLFVSPSYPVAAERAELGLLIADVGIFASLWHLPGTMHGIHLSYVAYLL
jgi:hypothetical protein